GATGIRTGRRHARAHRCARRAARHAGNRVRRRIARARTAVTDPSALSPARRRRSGCRRAARSADDRGGRNGLPLPPPWRHAPARDDGARSALDEPRGGRRLARRGLASTPCTPYPAAAGAPIVRAWAGLYDMTPDAHPILGWLGHG